jgi:hypothetical protein
MTTDTVPVEEHEATKQELEAVKVERDSLQQQFTLLTQERDQLRSELANSYADRAAKSATIDALLDEDALAVQVHRFIEQQKGRASEAATVALNTPREGDVTTTGVR